MTARVLVTGATGYVGGRLVPALLDEGHEVRVLVRGAARLASRPWADHVEVQEGDALDPTTLGSIADGVDVAYYLIHSMGQAKDFHARDVQAAHCFFEATRRVPHLVYLGGLLPSEPASEHLESRAAVGRILGADGRATEFRAGPIIGSGSASFEMVRYLTERLPAMVAPKWIDNRVRPIGIRDVVTYLLAAADKPPQGVLDIGGDVVTFRDMMRTYARERGLRRVIVPTPVLAPGLAALWVQLVTPIPNAVAVPLIRGILHDLVGDPSRAAHVFPGIQPEPYQRALRRAIERTQALDIETRWSDAGHSGNVFVEDWENVMRESVTLMSTASSQELWRSVTSLGGERGWPSWSWAWKVRGAVDRVLGGPGLRRGRRHPDRLRVGDALDWWRVEAIEPGRMLRLRAEMRLPGQAWLQFEVDPQPASVTVTALFSPDGAPGTLYWKALAPVHRLLFPGLAKAVVEAAEASSDTSSSSREN